MTPRNRAGPYGPYPPSPYVLCLPFVYGKLSQSISLIREVRNVETKKNSQERLNNNVVIKYSQEPLVLKGYS